MTASSSNSKSTSTNYSCGCSFHHGSTFMVNHRDPGCS